MNKVHGGCSSAAERLTVAQDVVGSIPTSRPNNKVKNLEKILRSSVQRRAFLLGWFLLSKRNSGGLLALPVPDFAFVAANA